MRALADEQTKAQAPRRRAGHRIDVWEPDDEGFWARTGRPRRGAYFFMDNLTMAASAYTAREMLTIGGRLQTVVMSVLYIGTFGSFVGYAFSFGVLINSQFPAVKSADYIWVGAAGGLTGPAARGWPADRFGGARSP